MRQSTRSTASSASSSSNLPSKGRLVQVELIDGRTMCIPVDGRKTKVQDVFTSVCTSLGLREVEYFGLARISDVLELEFLDLKKELRKVVTRSLWRSAKKSEKPFLTLCFCVQYYADQIHHIRERLTRQLFYHQLKHNWLHYNHVIGDDRCFLLASYALQAELGPWHALQDNTQDYFNPKMFLPLWMVEQYGLTYISKHLPTLHRDLGRMSRSEAALHFMQELSRHTVTHMMHLYQASRAKDTPLGTCFLGIGPKGLEVYERHKGFLHLLSMFEWANILRLHPDKKKFELTLTEKAGSRKFTYFTGSETRSEQLLSFCRQTHQFKLTQEPKIEEQRHLAAEDLRQRELYIHSNGLRYSGSSQKLQNSRKVKLNTPVASSGFNRNPSSTSSNTTSGIASEKLHTSVEEEEDTLSQQEIFIVGPPQTLASQPVKVQHAPAQELTPSFANLLSSQHQASPSSSSVTHQAATSITHSASSSRSSQPGVERPGPTPADTQIQRTGRIPTMTVSSNPVGQPALPAHNAYMHHRSPDSSGGEGTVYTPQQQANGLYTMYTQRHMRPPTQYSNRAGPHGFFSAPAAGEIPLHLQAQPSYCIEHTYANIGITNPAIYAHSRLPVNYSSEQPIYYNMAAIGPIGQHQSQPSRLAYTPAPMDHIHVGPDYWNNTNVSAYPYPQQVIQGRPNRSQSQVQQPLRTQLPPRAASNADALVSKRAQCAVHGVLRQLQQQLHHHHQAEPTADGNGGGKRLPLLTALLHDQSIQESCTCDRGTRRLSLVTPVMQNTFHTPVVNLPQGGGDTGHRPLSWHSESFQIDVHQPPPPQWDIPLEFGAEHSGYKWRSPPAPPTYQYPPLGLQNPALHQSLEHLVGGGLQQTSPPHVEYWPNYSSPTNTNILSKSVDNLMQPHPQNLYYQQ